MNRILEVAIMLTAFTVVAATDSDTYINTVQSQTSTDVTTALTVNKWRYVDDNNNGIWTRAYVHDSYDETADYDYVRPGDLIRVKPGDTLTITLNNNMESLACDETGVNGYPNIFHNADTTGLHTHGLHVSSDAPSDSIWTAVAPGDNSTFVYNIPSDHAGGTHWYHAHHHGSTALHAGGGLAGVMIVEDAECDVPSYVTAMPEKTLMFVAFDPPALWDIAGQMCDGNGDGLTVNDYTSTTERLLLNGMVANDVDVSVVQNTATRVRIVFASIENSFSLELDDNSCQWKLLAKDGIYVDNAPRDVTDGKLYFGPGNRADVVLLCDTVGTFSITATSITAGGRGAAGTTSTTTFNLIVSGASDSADTWDDITTFTARRPEYLYDLTTVATVTSGDGIEFRGGGAAGGGCTVNDQAFAYDEPLTGMSVATGNAYEWSLDGGNGHPFHLHVNPYQITELSATDSTGWFQVGDWHDVVYTGNHDVEVNTVRFSADRFTGDMVVHCHFLEHEDGGCMGFVTIDGTSDATTGFGETDLVVTTGEAVAETCTYETSSFDDDDDDGSETDESTILVVVVSVVGGVGVLCVIGVALFLVCRSRK